MDSLEFLNDALDDLKSRGLFRWPRILNGEQAPIATYDGKEIINLSSNNYLGLTNHPKVKGRAKEAIDKYGAGICSERTIAGNMQIHEELEEKLADFKRVEKVVLFKSGYTANISVLSTILDSDDIIIADQFNHLSVIDGCQLSKTELLTFDHANIKQAEKMLEEAQHKNPRRTLLVTDGIFGMDGDIAKLPELVKLAKNYNAIMMINDAHASGVLGRNGRGTVDHYNLHGEVDIEVGTLSMALAGIGGYAAGSQNLIEYLMHHARFLASSTPIPPSVAASVLAALEVIEEDNTSLERLWENTRYFKAGLKQLGFDTGNSQTPIIPMMVGDERKAIRFSDRLFEKGLFAPGIIYPTVPQGRARIRAVVTAGHTKDALNKALDIIEEVSEELTLIRKESL